MFRKILKVKTIGNRKQGNLRPAFSDELPRGANYQVHEYNEAEGWCIVEVYGSDKLMSPKVRLTVAKLNSIRANPNVIEELPSHPLSPPKMAEFAMLASNAESIDTEKKTAVIGGKEVSILRKEKRLDAHGEDEDVIVIDEG